MYLSVNIMGRIVLTLGLFGLVSCSHVTQKTDRATASSLSTGNNYFCKSAVLLSATKKFSEEQIGLDSDFSDDDVTSFVTKISYDSAVLKSDKSSVASHIYNVDFLKPNGKKLRTFHVQVSNTQACEATIL